MKADNQRDKLISQTFPKYCGSIIAATIASTISSFVDGCITGKMLGAEAMAAFGVAMPFVLILVVVPGIILSSGGSICCSIFIGENNRERADANFTACCMTGAIVGVIAAVICLLCSGWIIGITGVTGNVASEATAYMRGYSIGAIPTVLLSILMYYSNLDGHEKTSLLAVVVMTVVDIVLDLILGVRLGWGLLGMALATSISYVCAVIIFVILFLKGHSSYTLKFRNQKTELVDIVKNGYPSALNTLLVSARCFFINMILVAVAGQVAVTAFSFQSNFNQFFVAIASGISTTVSALTGIFIGERDRNKIDCSVSAGFKVGIVLTCILMVILFFGAPALADLLIKGNESEIQYSVNALRFFSLSMPFSSICIVLISFYQTVGNRKLANIIAVGHGLVFIIISALVLSSFMGLNGVWLSTLCGEILMLLTLFVYIWIHEKKMPHKLTDLAVMEERLLENEEDVYCASAIIEDSEASERLSSGLMAYLSDHNVKDSVSSVWTDTWQCLKGLCNKNTYADIQSYICRANGDETNINLRFAGKEVYSELEKGLGNKLEKELQDKGIDFHYRFGAGISFINIKQEESQYE